MYFCFYLIVCTQGKKILTHRLSLISCTRQNKAKFNEKIFTQDGICTSSSVFSPTKRQGAEGEGRVMSPHTL